MECVEGGEQFPAGVVAEDADVCQVWGLLGLIIYGRRLVRDLSFLICSFAGFNYIILMSSTMGGEGSGGRFIFSNSHRQMMKPEMPPNASSCS